MPNVERATRILSEQGVPFLSEIAPCCSGQDSDSGGIVHAIDPDGVFLELVGDLTPRPVPPQPEQCPPLEIRYPQSLIRSGVRSVLPGEWRRLTEVGKLLRELLR